MSHVHAKGYLLELANKSETEGWLKDLIVKIVNNNGNLSEGDLTDTLNQLKEGGQAVLTIPSVDSLAIGNTIQLVSLKHNSGVCALTGNQEIKFSKDITLLYGMNGSGKSSYFRILNEMAGGNCQQIIRPNIYIENNPAIDVELKFEDNSGIHTISWNGATRAISNLRGISVFDSNYTNSFLERRSADSAIIHPYGLYLFSSLSSAMDKVNQLIQSEIDNIRRNLPQINLQDMSGLVTKVISSTQYDKIQKDYIQERYDLTEQHKEELEQLNNQIKQLSETNYADKIKLENSNQSQYEKLLQFIKDTYEGLEENEKQVRQLIDNIKTSRQKAKEIKAKISILQEIGNTESPEWKMFIKSADSFTQSSSLSDDVCPYCRQSLNSSAKSIIESYAIFLNDKSLLELEQLEKKKDALSKTISSIQTEYSLSEYFSELIKSQDETLINLIDTVLREFTRIKSALLKNLQEEIDESLQKLNEIEKLVAALSDISVKYTHLLSELQQKNEKKEQMLKELREKQVPLLERRSIYEQKKLLQRWFEDMHLIHRLQRLQGKLSTRNVSNLAKIANKELITDNLFQKFKEEMKTLGIGALDVNMVESGVSKGQSFMQLKLHHNHDVTHILSEGEQKGVALALFLAERQMEVDKNPIIMDDPVNSLDHCITSRLVERLISLNNQIILFSHHLLLKSTLINLPGLHECGVNQQASCHKTTRHLFLYKVWDYGRCQKGVVYEDKQDNVSNNLNDVRKLLEKKPFNNQDSISAGAQLRHVIELLIDEKIFNGQIPIEFHGRKNNIPWEQLKGLNPDVNLVDKLKNLFSRLSGGSLHVGIEQIENPIDHAELESIYNELMAI